MECNRDEAERGKDMAEKKMEKRDFSGAKNVILRSQRLYPALENISQMLTVCEIHCSAEQKLFGVEKDWYGILQIEQTADEISIKKQYRKLALVLHPDKNKFPGAEAAFKLIGEAHRFLTDQMKRSVYDMKLKSLMATAVPKQGSKPTNKKSFCSKQPGVQSISVNGGNLHQQQQQSGPGVPIGKQTFWTKCPSCSIRYMYYSDVLGRSICCQSCQQPFVATADSQGEPSGINLNQSMYFQQNTSVNNSQNTGFQGNQSGAATASKQFSGTQSNSTTNKKRQRNNGNAGNGIGTEGDEVIKENGRCTRKSPRKKQHVSYNENLGNHDASTNPLKKPMTGSTNDTDEQSSTKFSGVGTSKTNDVQGFSSFSEGYKENVKQEGRLHPEKSIPNGSDGAEQIKTNGAEALNVNVGSTSKPSQSPENKPDPEFVEYPDPDFNDFDKERAEDRFAVNQIWAVYDNSDSMPRFYACIRKVWTPFKLRITWLEANPDKQDEIDWFREDLPVACGKFILGNTENTEDRLMFSHLMAWERGTRKGSYMLFPRRGETWALFKNWDIGWKSDPDNHRQYEFDFVEVLSDYVVNQGITVAYLVKVKGFVALFKQTSKKSVIPGSEIFRFSHRIPSFKMTGMEREGVPGGSFELDPASFCGNVEDSSDQVEENEKAEGVESEVNGSSSKAEEVEFLKENTRPTMPKTSTDEKITQDSEILKGETELQSELNGNDENNLLSQTNAGQCPTKEETSKHSECTKEKSRGGSSPGDTSSFQVDTSPPSFMASEEIPETIFYNFDGNRAQEKFRPGQFWALYSDEDGFPKYYAQITKVDASPNFKLYITWLESCPTPKSMLQWEQEDMPVGCGVFRLSTSLKTDYPDVTPFSHQVNVESLSRNKYEIYPRKGEIWALYKDFNSKWTCFELANCDYDMVEIVEVGASAIKVLALKLVDGFKTVFRAEAVGGSNSALEVPRVEMVRFSHQVPAFQLTEESYGTLRGCWELDSSSFPVR